MTLRRGYVYQIEVVSGGIAISDREVAYSVFDADGEVVDRGTSRCFGGSSVLSLAAGVHRVEVSTTDGRKGEASVTVVASQIVGFRRLLVELK